MARYFKKKEYFTHFLVWEEIMGYLVVLITAGGNFLHAFDFFRQVVW